MHRPVPTADRQVVGGAKCSGQVVLGVPHRVDPGGPLRTQRGDRRRQCAAGPVGLVGVLVTTAVMTAVPNAPSAEITFRSALLPAPPLGSVPAIVNTVGTYGAHRQTPAASSVRAAAAGSDRRRRDRATVSSASATPAKTVASSRLSTISGAAPRASRTLALKPVTTELVMHCTNGPRRRSSASRSATSGCSTTATAPRARPRPRTSTRIGPRPPRVRPCWPPAAPERVRTHPDGACPV